MFKNLCVLGNFELWLDMVGSIFAKAKIQHDTLKTMEAKFKSGVDSPRELIDIFLAGRTLSKEGSKSTLQACSQTQNPKSVNLKSLESISPKVSLIQSKLYMRSYPLRWGIMGMLIALLPKSVQMKFSFMCGLAIKARS